jgi:hypothetical protein
MGDRPEKEASAMKCTTCGSDLTAVIADLPFKLGPNSIVILKQLSVLQCVNCPEHAIQDAVLCRVDEMLGRVDTGAELEIFRFAA